MKRVALLLASMLVAFPAHADIWGYIDADGTRHLATEKLDARYQLFMKTVDGRAVVQRPDDEPTLAPDEALMKTALFRRLIDHPNIRKYEPLIERAAARHGLDPHFVKAVIAVESGFEPRAVSTKGAVGLMQVLPATGERFGVRADRSKSVDEKLTDPTLNLEIGTRYLSLLRTMFTNRPDLMLAAYNAGENAVIRYRNAVPPFPETQAYVKLVDQFHAFYNPRRGRVTTVEAEGRQRLRVTIPARRNLPDPSRLPIAEAPPSDTPAVTVPFPR